MGPLQTLVLWLCLVQDVLAIVDFTPRPRPQGGIITGFACSRGMSRARDNPYQLVYNTNIEDYILCDAVSDGGGWIIIQRRLDGIENFSRRWKSYVKGFGNKKRDHWLGLAKIKAILDAEGAEYELRIDLVFHNSHFNVTYSKFSLGEEQTKFMLHLGGDSKGNLPHDHSYGLAYSRGAGFSTRDQDNDWSSRHHCAFRHGGGWWFKWCAAMARANLNGYWNKTSMNGMFWDVPGMGLRWIQSSEIKIRPHIV